MEPSFRGRIESVWAQRLGCDASLFRTPGIHPLAHPQPGALYAVRVGKAAIVAAPREMHDRLRELAAVEAGSLARLVPGGARWVGPAFVGYAPARPPGIGTEVRVISAEQLDPLRRAVSATEWEHARPDLASPIFVAFAGGALASAAGAERLPSDVAHLRVVTHPAHRGRGLGRAVVSAALAHALDEGLLAQYQTLLANQGAISIAQALGFELFATTIAARWSDS